MLCKVTQCRSVESLSPSQTDMEKVTLAYIRVLQNALHFVTFLPLLAAYRPVRPGSPVCLFALNGKDEREQELPHHPLCNATECNK